MGVPEGEDQESLGASGRGTPARDAERRFGVSRESAARWRRGRDGNPAGSAGPVL